MRLVHDAKSLIDRLGNIGVALVLAGGNRRILPGAQRDILRVEDAFTPNRARVPAPQDERLHDQSHVRRERVSLMDGVQPRAELALERAQCLSESWSAGLRRRHVGQIAEPRQHVALARAAMSRRSGFDLLRSETNLLVWG